MLALGQPATLQRAAASVMPMNDVFGSPSSEAGQLGKVRNATRPLLRYRQCTVAGALLQEYTTNNELRVHEHWVAQSPTQCLGRAATLQRAAAL